MNLTKEQALQKIKELQEYIENSEKVSIGNINYPKACEILGNSLFRSDHFICEYQWYEHQLATIIRAINYLDNNNKEWIPEFSNSEYKHKNWFVKSGGSWAFNCCSVDDGYSCAPAWLHFKNKASAEKATKNKTIFDLYCKILG